MAVTQTQLAKMAGVSRATVDRVVNNRGRVDPEVEMRIRKLIEETGYQNNKVGSMLARTKNPLKIGVIIESIETLFMQYLKKEFEKRRISYAAENVDIIIRCHEGVDAKVQAEQIQELGELGIKGLAISPAENEIIHQKLEELDEKGIPVVTFNTDMPDFKRLCYVGQDAYLTGRLCAGLMDMLLSGKGKILMITGKYEHLALMRRVEGFKSEVLSAFPGLKMLPLLRCNDDSQLAHDLVIRSFAETPDIDGIYLASTGQLGVCAALHKLGIFNKVKFICNDFYPELLEYIMDKTIDFTIDQDVEMQASKPLDILVEYLLSGKRPDNEFQLVRNDIRCSYNAR